MLRPLYNWAMRLAEGRHATTALVAVSFAESSFFPLPPDTLLIPMVLANREKAFRFALLCTVASVIGGMVGYAIGSLLYDTLGQWIIKVYGLNKGIEDFRKTYQEWGAVIILAKGVTPIPYKLVTLTSGFSHYNFFWFVLLSILSRGVRFFGEAWLLKRYGEPVREFIERRLNLVALATLGAIVLGFLVVKYVV